MSATQRVSKPFLIGVAGGTASGKSTVCQKIMAKLGQDCHSRVALIKQDSFYRQLSADELALARKGCFNFDHPDAIDELSMYTALRDILDGTPVRLPIHDYQDNRPKPGEFYEVQSADVVLFEGVLIFYFPKVRDMFHMKLFVDTDSDIRLSRRVIRDVRERGRPLDVVLTQYDQFVKPAFEEFCQPTKKYADMIIPRGADNEVAIGLINYNVTYLLSREFANLRNGIAKPMPFRAAAAAAAIVVAPNSSVVGQVPTLGRQSPDIGQMLADSAIAMRSRSNSRVSTSSIMLAAGQRVDADIKEEQDGCSQLWPLNGDGNRLAGD